MSKGSDCDVQLVGLTKQFTNFTAVNDINLDIRSGEFISLLGPSGCGKTTTLNLIAGFEEPTAGEVRVGGRSMTGVPSYRRDVNTVFQSYALFPHLSVLDNVAYGLKQRKVDRTERRQRASEMLDLVGLSGRETARPTDLSGGQQQRVALARALVLQPRVLLLDEPLAALDLKLRRKMQIELKRIHRDVGLTFVFVTHDQDEAMSMSDRIAVMNGGRIEHLGAPAEVYDKPATPFVAGFIGEMNTLVGTLVHREANRWRARFDDGSHVEGSVMVSEAAEGSPVKLGIRPERLRIRETGDGLRATVLTTMILGDQLQRVVRLEATGQELIAREPRHSEADHIPHGSAAVVQWLPDAITLLGPVEHTHTKETR